MLDPQATTIVNTGRCLELDNGSSTLHFSLNGGEHRLGRNTPWADLRTPEEGWQVLSREHARFLLVGNEYQLLDGNGQQGSSNGIFLNHQRVDGEVGLLLRHGMTLEIGQNPKNLIRLTYYNPSELTTHPPTTYRSLDLGTVQHWPVELGRSVSTQHPALELLAPTVSRVHALIEKQGDRYHIRDNNSANGTFVNGQRVVGSVALADRATITIGPFQLILKGQKLELYNPGNPIRLDAHNIVREVAIKGKKLQILNQVSLPIEPGQLVALVGGSGAGKSTLMKVLLGIESLKEGAVFLNGADLRQDFQVYRTQIGYVPQDDIVHYNLRVKEVLQFACKLRLPPDADFEQVIQTTLSQVQLTHVQNNFIRDLSGGQRKRVSIAVELLADPKLFFLDEPTSGLDPGLDKQMMDLLRELANQGRTVILVTHATENITICDRIAFMGRGGYLCYYGPPSEAMDFFEISSDHFSDIYIRLDQEQEVQGRKIPVPEIVKQWSQRFLQSPQHQSYVAHKLSSGNMETGQASHQAALAPSKISPLNQWWHLSHRYITLMSRDYFSLGLALLTAPLTLLILKVALRDENPLVAVDPLTVTQAPLALRVMYIFTCLGIWVGLSSSVQAIVKEIHIYKRERLVNLGLLPYVGSKLAVHLGLALVQTLLITVTALIVFEPPSPDLISWPVGLSVTTFLVLASNLSLGLMISSWVKNEDQSNSILPSIMLFQIILSGVLFNLEGLADTLSKATMSRWSNMAYAAIVNINAMVPEPVTLPDGTVMERVFEPLSMYDATWNNLGQCWGILLLHMGVYLGFTLWGLVRKDAA
jgi:ABC transport system ATP-binding/permease protein